VTVYSPTDISNFLDTIQLFLNTIPSKYKNDVILFGYQVMPQMDHFTESAFSEIDTSTKDLWNDCKETMMVNLHKRNRERGESKLKFQVSF
jgi:hypothetical protein